jgi:hypothetical protein
MEAVPFIVEATADKVREFCINNKFKFMPLSTYKYVEVKSDEDMEDLEKCVAADRENKIRYQSNKRVADVINKCVLTEIFGRPITVPMVNHSYEAEHHEYMRKLRSDPQYRLRKAVEILYGQGMVAVKDYKVEDAIKLASDIIHKSTMEKYRSGERKWTVKLPGIQPFEWDGCHRVTVGSRTIDWVPAQRSGFDFLDPVMIPGFVVVEEIINDA